MKGMSRPPASTRGLKRVLGIRVLRIRLSRPPARTRGLKRRCRIGKHNLFVASSGDAAWIETGGGIREYPYLSEVCVDWNKMSSFFCLDLLNFNEYKTKKEGDH